MACRVFQLSFFQSTFEIGRREESSQSIPVKVVKKKLSREPGASLVTALGPETGPGQSLVSSRPEEHVYVNNYEYADFYNVHGHGPATCGSRKSEESDDHMSSETGSGSRVGTSGGHVARRCGVYSTESDSGLDVTPDSGTPYTGSRPESELLLDTGDREEAEVEASPRQLEIMMNRSKERAQRDSRCDYIIFFCNINAQTCKNLL